MYFFAIKKGLQHAPKWYLGHILFKQLTKERFVIKVKDVPEKKEKM